MALLLLAAGPSPTPTPLPAPFVPPRVAVVCVGGAPEAAGALQFQLETRLRQTVPLLGASDFGPALRSAVEPSPTPDPKVRADADALLSSARDDFYGGRLVASVDKLASLIAVQDKNGNFDAVERAQVRLWRAAVYQALGGDAQASQEALAALRLAPDLTVSTKEFSPRVKSLVESLRPTIGLATLQVNGNVPAFEVQVDGRAAGLRSRVSVGSHRVRVSAPGFRSVTRTLSVTADQTVSFALASALPPTMASALEVAVTGLAEEGDPSMLASARRLLGAGVLAVVVPSNSDGTEGSAAVFAPDRPRVVASGPEGDLETFLASAIAAAREAPAALPPETLAPSPLRRTGGFAARAGVTALERIRTLSDASGSRDRAGFSGVGPEVGVSYLGGSFLAGAELWQLSYPLAGVRVRLPDGSTQSVSGGSAYGGALEGGWRLGADPDGPGAAGLLALTWESLAARDLTNGTGAAGLLTSYTRTGLEARVRGFWPVGPMAFLGGASFSPYSSWTESPTGTTGQSPKGGLGLGWQLGASLRAGRRTTLVAAYQGSIRSVSFTGTGSATVTPAYHDAQVSETFQGISVIAQVGF